MDTNQYRPRKFLNFKYLTFPETLKMYFVCLDFALRMFWSQNYSTNSAIKLGHGRPPSSALSCTLSFNYINNTNENNYLIDKLFLIGIFQLIFL